MSEDLVQLEHFLYGSYEGYRMKAQSPEVSPEGHTEIFQGFLLPIRQVDLDNLEELQMLMSEDENMVYFSRLIKGLKDDHGRGTMANHTALVPKKLLMDGSLTYANIDKAMKEWEAGNMEAVGDIPTLEVAPGGDKPDTKELRRHMDKEILQKMIGFYREDPEQKIFLHYKRSHIEQRLELAYLLSHLIDLELKVIPLSIFPDTPFSSSKRAFNLVISRAMLDIKPGGDWVMLPVEGSGSYGSGGKAKSRKIDNKLDSIFG